MLEAQDWLGGPIEVIPAVDVLGEEAVRLHQGAYDEVVERAGDPVELARALRARPAPRRIHLVDLDGARSGRVAAGARAARSPARSRRRRSRPRAGSARSRTRGRCSTRAPTASSSARRRCPTRRRGPRARRAARRRARRAGRRRCAPPAGRRTRACRRRGASRGAADAGVDARPLHRDRPRRHARRARPRARRAGRRRRACACSPRAASARRRTSWRSPPPAPRRPSSAARCSRALRGDQRQVGLQRGQVEAVRRLPAGRGSRREDRVDLVAVAIPERPGHLLQPAPGDDRERRPVVARPGRSRARPTSRASPARRASPSSPTTCWSCAVSGSSTPT